MIFETIAFKRNVILYDLASAADRLMRKIEEESYSLSYIGHVIELVVICNELT